MLDGTLHTPRRAIVIHSPHSGRSAQFSEALAYLQLAGVEVVQSIPVADLDNLPSQGASWKERGIDVAIAAGGDGLVGGVITHIAERGPALGILPLGTANDIARSLKIPLELPTAAAVIAHGNLKEVDVGVARPAEQAPHLASKGQSGPVRAHVAVQKHGFFAHALTVGLNVQFARIATNVATRLRFGRLTYPVATLELLKYHEALDVQLQFEELVFPQYKASMQGQPTPVSATTDDLSSLRCRALQVAVINAPIFGGQWQLAIPNASVSDRLLDIVVIEEIEFGNLNRILARFFGSLEQNESPAPALQEHHITHHPAELSGIPGIHHLQAKGVMITTNADPRDVTLDGEVRGQTPLYVHMAEERLRVVVPNRPFHIR
jgi:diacylglycerol kinase (ATP)